MATKPNKPCDPKHCQEGVPCPNCGATDGRCVYITEELVDDFLANINCFSSIDSFRDYYSKNRFLSMFDAESLNEHIRIFGGYRFVEEDNEVFVELPYKDIKIQYRLN